MSLMLKSILLVLTFGAFALAQQPPVDKGSVEAMRRYSFYATTTGATLTVTCQIPSTETGVEAFLDNMALYSSSATTATLSQGGLATTTDGSSGIVKKNTEDAAKIKCYTASNASPTRTVTVVDIGSGSTMALNMQGFVFKRGTPATERSITIAINPGAGTARLVLTWGEK